MTDPAEGRRCIVEGCHEARYVSPGGKAKQRCARHDAAHRRPAGTPARNWRHYHGDAVEQARK